MKISFTLLLLLHFTFSFSQWTRVQQLPPSDIFSLYQANNVLYAGGVNIIYFSSNNGQSWDSTNSIPQLVTVDNIIVFKGELYASSFGFGVFKSPDGGNTWQNIGAGIDLIVSDFCEWKGDLYASTLGNSVFKLNPATRNNWLHFNNGISNLSLNVNSIAATSNSLIAGSLANGLYDYIPGNSNVWEERFLLNQISPTERSDDIITAHDSLFLSGSTGRFYLSTDQGLNWSRFGNSSPSQLTLLANAKQAFLAARNIFNGQTENTLFAYTKKDSLAEPFVVFSFVPNHYSYKILTLGNKLWDASTNGLFFMSLSDLPGISAADDSTLLIPLPLRYDSFNVTLKNDKTVSVHWKTADETNIDHFEVERSVNGSTWSKLVNIDPQSSHDYFYTDISPQPGENYYRIKAIGTDGKTFYTAIKLVVIENKTKFLVFPNPAHDVVFVNIVNSNESPVTIKIFDNKGALVKVQHEILSQGNNQLPVDIRSLAQGIYTLSADWNNGQNTKSVRLLKE
jgi:hypothetical protein